MLKVYTITVEYHKYLNKSIYKTFLNRQIHPPYAQKTQKPQRIYVCTSRFTDCVSSGLPTQTDISIHSPGRVSKRPFIESCETLLK